MMGDKSGREVEVVEEETKARLVYGDCQAREGHR